MIANQSGKITADGWVFRKISREDQVKLALLGIYAGVLGAAALTAPNTDGKFNPPVVNQRR